MIRLRSQLITGRCREKCGRLLQTKPKVYEDITNHLTAQKTGTGYPDPTLILPRFDFAVESKWRQMVEDWQPCSPIHRLCACKTETIVSRLDFPWNIAYSTTNQPCQLSRLKAWVSRLQDGNVVLTRIHACRANFHAVWPASNPIPVHMQTSTSATSPVSTNFAIFLPMCWIQCSLWLSWIADVVCVLALCSPARLLFMSSCWLCGMADMSVPPRKVFTEKSFGSQHEIYCIRMFIRTLYRCTCRTHMSSAWLSPLPFPTRGTCGGMQVIE